MDRDNTGSAGHQALSTDPSAPDVAALETALSTDRFGRYRAWAGDDTDRALYLYALNIRLSEALYPPLHMLEVILRNRIHTILAAAIHPDWFQQPGFLVVPHQTLQIDTALTELARETRDPTPSRIVSALTFSFWTTMLGPSYENLWQTHLHRIGRRSDGKGLRRKDFSGPLTPIRILRNRIAHHEPILGWNLSQHHDAMHRLAAWLSPKAANWGFALDRFAAVYPPARIDLLDD